MVFLRKILVTTDLSEFSLAAFEYASTASIFFNAEIFLLYVYEGSPVRPAKITGRAVGPQVPGVSFPAGTGGRDVRPPEADEAGWNKPHGDREPRGHAHYTEEEALKALREFVKSSVSSGLNVNTVVRRGTPAEEIIRYAEQEGVDLIVIATHGRTGLRHIVMGSVAERIVRLSNIPVLSVKPGPFRDRILKDEDIENELHLRP
jgi:nucleotide-binding universal stress UspA family protein